jgi:phage/plasmid primase-like uncharacterized protein
MLCKAAGLEPPDEIHFDGKIHRFRSGTKGSPGHGDKPGWYLVFGDGIPAGRFGCWRAGMERHGVLMLAESSPNSRKWPTPDE